MFVLLSTHIVAFLVASSYFYFQFIVVGGTWNIMFHFMITDFCIYFRLLRICKGMIRA